MVWLHCHVALGTTTFPACIWDIMESQGQLKDGTNPQPNPQTSKFCSLTKNESKFSHTWDPIMFQWKFAFFEARWCLLQLIRGVNPKHSEGIAVTYLPGEGVIKSICLTLQLTKHFHTGDWVFERLESYVPGWAVQEETVCTVLQFQCEQSRNFTVLGLLEMELIFPIPTLTVLYFVLVARKVLTVHQCFGCC